MAHRLNGGCLCGAVRFVITGALIDPLNCHCRMCRKAQGIAFRSRAAVRRSTFELIDGAANLTAYASSPGEYRMFCAICGSPIMTQFDRKPEWLGIPLGALDDPMTTKPARHVHTGSRAPWHTITDALPQSEAGREPERD